MKKIISISEAIKISNKLRSENKSIVLVGGCFDILHVGHIEFLRKAKEKGDYLFVILENNEKIKKIKGENRPINNQEDRAKVLEALIFTDYIIPLKNMENDEDYDQLILNLKPAIIATTKGDPFRKHKERQAKLVDGKVIDVVERISKRSTSELAEKILKDYYL